MNSLRRSRQSASTAAVATLFSVAAFSAGVLFSAGAARAVIAVKGDLNGDGKITRADVRVVSRIMVRPDAATPAQIQAADVNGDGAVDMRDVRILLRQSS